MITDTLLYPSPYLYPLLDDPTELQPALQEILKLISCGCKKSRGATCGCR